MFRDQIVLVGGDFRSSGDDYHRIPHRSGKNRAMSGLTLQALMMDTIGAGLPIREAGKTPVFIIASLGVTLAIAGALCVRRPAPVAAWLALGAALYIAITFPVFWWTGLMLPVTVPLLLVLLGFLAALILRRNLSSPLVAAIT